MIETYLLYQLFVCFVEELASCLVFCGEDQYVCRPHHLQTEESGVAYFLILFRVSFAKTKQMEWVRRVSTGCGLLSANLAAILSKRLILWNLQFFLGGKFLTFKLWQLASSEKINLWVHRKLCETWCNNRYSAFNISVVVANLRLLKPWKNRENKYVLEKISLANSEKNHLKVHQKLYKKLWIIKYWAENIPGVIAILRFKSYKI